MRVKKRNRRGRDEDPTVATGTTNLKIDIITHLTRKKALCLFVCGSATDMGSIFECRKEMLV